MIKRNARPLIVDRNDLSLAWSEIFLKLLSAGTTEICPLLLSITGFSDCGIPNETASVRERLDELLKAKGVATDIETVAFTIFPDEYWRLANKNRAEFFDLYRKSFTRIQDWNPRNNKRGSYFQRLTDYEGDDKGHNQLAWILNEFDRRPGQRVSQFQATTFDPLRDQTTTALLEFPCLQHVSFVPMHDETLTMNAFYATQQIFPKRLRQLSRSLPIGSFYG